MRLADFLRHRASVIPKAVGGLRRVLRWSALAALSAVAVAVILGLGLRFFFLPNIQKFRPEIEAVASRSVGRPVSIGGIVGDWDGLNPYLLLADLRIRDGANDALELPTVRARVSWRSIFGELRLLSLEVEHPRLVVRRDQQGALYIGGIALAGASHDTQLSDWVLRQPGIAVRDGELTWQDDKRSAPPLHLRQVALRLHGERRKHQLIIEALPPQNLASALRIELDAVGEGLGRLHDWSAQLRLQLEMVDLAGWRPWIDYPWAVSAGTGAVRATAEYRDGRIEQARAEVALRDVLAQFDPSLQPLQLRRISGEFSGAGAAAGFWFRAKNVAFETVAGVSHPAADFELKVERGRAAEFAASRLELQPVARLAVHLPLPTDVAAMLARYQPEGVLADCKLGWSLRPDAPSAPWFRARFERVGIRPAAGEFAFAGLSGSIDSNAERGVAVLDTHDATIDLPMVFPEERFPIDTLAAKLAWRRENETIHLSFDEARVENAHAAVRGSGRWQNLARGPGYLELDAAVSRADAKFAPKYVPYIAGAELGAWLRRALVAGSGTEGRVRIRGDLWDFPFPADRGGIFEVTGEVRGGVLDYWERWPRLEDISARLEFRGDSITIRANSARILSAQIGPTEVRVSDMMRDQVPLDVRGTAQGATSEFLRFIAASPVRDMIGRATDGVSANGNGKLRLGLRLPLYGAVPMKVDGAYQFAGNRLRLASNAPDFEHLNGELVFNDKGVRFDRLDVRILDGPAQLSGANTANGFSATLSGRATAAAVARFSGHPWLNSVTGDTEYRGTFNQEQQQTSLVIESNLSGLRSSLPAPLAKDAATAWPFRFTRNTREVRSKLPRDTTGRHEREDLIIELPGRAAAHIVRRLETAGARFDRAGIAFGQPAKVPEAGVLVAGHTDRFDLDAWRAPLAALFGAPAAGGASRAASFDFSVDRLDAFGHRVTAAHLRGRAGVAGVELEIAAKEIAGRIEWQSTEHGRVEARLDYLHLPKHGVNGAGDDGDPPDRLPDLDLKVREFSLGGQSYGALELNATQDKNVWRIHTAKIRSADAEFGATGRWHIAPRNAKGEIAPYVDLDLNLKIFDAARLLDRLGYEKTLRVGTIAALEGKLNWQGSPIKLDRASLGGAFRVTLGPGQFLKAEPGIARLIGVLSLQALPKRITLDFRDVFSDGFAFDSVTASVRVNKGVMSTEDFLMQGPAAVVNMQGDIDLGSERQYLRVRVIPSLGDGISVVALLLQSPLAGLATYLAQKIFKDPIGKLFAYDYSITGTWDDPRVDRVTEARPAPPRVNLPPR